MNIKALFRDKKFVGVVAVGSLVGVYALYRSKGSSATSSAADQGSVAGSSGSGATPTFQDGGSDIAATLGNFSTELQGILQNYADTQGSGATVPPPKTTTPITVKPIEKPKPVTKRKPAPKPPTYTSYKIKRGDTLSELAKRNHTTVGALAKLNGISNRNLIYAGRTLKIPKKK